MGSSLSVEEKVYKCAKEGDAPSLQSILQQLQRQGVDLSKVLECQDVVGQTPLIAASARGYFSCVELLLRHGANIHHFSRRPEGTTALHECVARQHLRVAELLLQYGANPFIENGRGLTCVDVAINKGNTGLVRSLELRSHFTGNLQVKVPKFMGLGSEWKQRWVVVMPRFQFPNPNTGASERVVRSLLVCYKASDENFPACKVWLDGAIARSVVGSKGSGVPQCALSLHKNHAQPSGAHMTGDPSVGYTMHLRPPDNSANASNALKRFMDIVNGARGQTRPPQQAPEPPGQAQAHSSSQTAPTPPLPPPPAAPGHHPSESDEDIARRLQQQYDAEMAEYMRTNPEAARAHMKLGGSSPFASAAHPAPPVSHHHSPASSSSFHSIPSAPMYPTIDQAGHRTHLMDAPPPNNGQAPPLAPQAQQGGVQNSSGRANGSPEWCAGNFRAAASPPPAAAEPSLPQQRVESLMSLAGPSAVEDDEAGHCVICLAAPATAGFLHGESVHKCCCRDCAQDLKKARVPTCPMCREPIDHVIFNFY